MFYYFRVIDELTTWQAQFELVAVLLLLEAGVLALTTRRAGAAPLVRVLLPVTMGWAIAALALAGYTWWQLQVLSPHIPFHRLPDGSIQYDRPLAVDVTHTGGVILLVGTAALLSSGALLLLRAVLTGASTAWRSRRSQRTA
jgi:hypothetical protein